MDVNCEKNNDINRYVNGLVSIIMPAYNSSKYIGESINSVIKQTYLNWELIIVDDCSTDDTDLIIKSYANKDARIKLINKDKNEGVVKARNAALRIANGEYIAFLDADDIWREDKLIIQLQFMKSNKYSFTFTAYEYIEEDSRKTGKVVHVPEYQDYKKALKNTIIGCSTVIINIGETGKVFMPELKHGEDHFTWIELIKRGFYAYGLDENLSEYRINKNSLSSNKFNGLKQQWRNYKNIEKLPIIRCGFYFTLYVLNAVKKRI